MIWIILLILVMLAAYFIYQGLRARHIRRCQNDNRTSEHVPTSITEPHEQKMDNSSGVHQGNGDAQTTPSGQSPSTTPDGNASRHNGESSNTAGSDATLDNAHQFGNTQAKNAGQHDTDTMDFTAETGTLSSDEVGLPANNSEYQSATQTDAVLSPTSSASVSGGSTAANAHSHNQQNTNANTNDASGSAPNSASGLGVAAGVVAAGIAGTAGAAGLASQTTSGNSSREHNGEQIDLELGDNTHNAGEMVGGGQTEPLEFGDLTVDIGEMLKELNLRESDSPRLDINKTEYQQLKMGEPGDIQPEKIENVAGKLRNMLR